MIQLFTIQLSGKDLENLCNGYQAYSNSLLANIQQQINAQLQTTPDQTPTPPTELPAVPTTPPQTPEKPDSENQDKP